MNIKLDIKEIFNINNVEEHKRIQKDIAKQILKYTNIITIKAYSNANKIIADVVNYKITEELLEINLFGEPYKKSIVIKRANKIIKKPVPDNTQSFNFDEPAVDEPIIEKHSRKTIKKPVEGKEIYRVTMGAGIHQVRNSQGELVDPYTLLAI